MLLPKVTPVHLKSKHIGFLIIIPSILFCIIRFKKKKKEKKKGCKMETGRGQMAAGIVGANRTPIRGWMQVGYSIMTASWGEGVRGVCRCLVKTKHQSIRGLGDLTRCLGVAEICACMEIDACQPVYDSTLTACMHVCFPCAHTSARAVLCCDKWAVLNLRLIMRAAGALKPLWTCNCPWFQ